METKFKIGDAVSVIKTRENGIITDIVSVLGEGDNTYLVEIDGLERMYAESYLGTEVSDEFIAERQLEPSYKQVVKEIDKVIDKLGLVETNDSTLQLANACKVQKYLALKHQSEVKKVPVTNSIIISELYDGLVNGESDYITYTYVFSEILKRVGMTAHNVGLRDENGKFYMANLVLIGDYYYYFDVTLEREIYLENCKSEEEFVLCCGALGSESYEQFFKPVAILNFEEDSKEDIPENISTTDIAVEIINNALWV